MCSFLADIQLSHKHRTTMRFIEFLLALLVQISMLTCLAGVLIKTSEPEIHSELANAAVEIVTSCYPNRGNGVVFAGTWAGTFSRILWSKLYLPAIILDDTRVMSDGPVNQDASYKLQVFVVTASSSKSLSTTLKDIKDSPWWNHMASVLILDSSVSNGGCSRSVGILRIAWEMNLLHAKFMCLDRTKKTLLYGYNPYTNRAPHPWKFVTTYRSNNTHPWTLFAQAYRQERDVCDELDFEKTTDLGTYEIRARVNNISGVWSTNPDKNGTDSFDGLDGSIARFLFGALKVTPSVVTYNWTYNIIPKIRDNKTVGGLIDLRNGIFDMGLNAWFPDMNATMSRTFRQTKIVVMTQYRGYMSQLAKIAAVLDKSSRFGLLLVALITLIFFRFCRRKSLMPAFLDVWRIYCNASIPKVPKSQASRIYLTGLYLLMINIQGIYQGKISALVTMPVPIPDVETAQDVVNLGLTVYGDKIFFPDFDKLTFGKVDFVAIDGHHGNCTEHVVNDYWAACVHEKNILNHEAAKFKLHVSEQPILTVHQLYAIRPDWPLEERINTVLARLVESGRVDYSDKIDVKETSRIRASNENLHTDQTFKVMTLEELTFAFSILGCGLTLAVMSFVVEIGIQPTRSRVQSFTSGIDLVR